MKLRRVLAGGLLTVSLMTFPGCTKTIDCTIGEEHVHLYVNEGSTLKRYIQSEKEKIGKEVRTETYKQLKYDVSGAAKNGLYPIEENMDYLLKLEEKFIPKREEYVIDYVYGPYIGYGLNPITGKYDYCYGNHVGYHYESFWREISLDEYTSNPVRDITYKFRLYKVNFDETVEYHDFDMFDVISDEYKFFKASDLIQPVIGETYTLSNEKTLVK